MGNKKVKIFNNLKNLLIPGNAISLPLPVAQGRVKEEWIDYNDHMNMAYYVQCFEESSDYLLEIINLGYAVPGVVIALGVLIFIKYINQFSYFTILATLIGLILALIIRLISISNNSIDSGLEKVGKSIDDASRLIGRRSSTTYFRIIIPQIRLSILAGFLLVFVDTIKELPITLLLRPFNFDTLATSLYEYSSNEMFENGSLHALTIILFLSLVIYLFDSVIEKKQILKTR